MSSTGPSPGDFDFAPLRDLLVTDFASTSADLGWYVVNDNVMGGRSEGGFELDDGALHFSGRTNTNGGGFSSIRTSPVTLDLSGHEGIRLRVNGDGRRYTWRLTTAARWRGEQVAYWADFETEKGEWSTRDIPFTRFVPRYRGSRLDGPELDTGEITGMGLMIYDDRDGPFDLRLASVHAYPARETFSLEQYRWKKRVLVVSAPNDADAELVRQRDSIASTDQAFAERDMLLVILLDEGRSTAGDRILAAEEVDETRKALGLSAGSFALRLFGKDGSVKLSREAATPMDEVYSLIDTMPMRRSEMPDR